MIKNRSRQYQAIKQGDGHANRNPSAYIAQHPAGSGTVNVQNIFLSAVTGRDDEWLAIQHEANMTNETFIQDSVHRVAIVNRALRLTDDACARCGR
jgi:hypothetical protein